MTDLYTPFGHPMYMMAKPAGSSCNLACKYCYYLEKNNLYKDVQPDRRFIMTDDILERFIKMYIESQTVPSVQFCWHGGESLMRPIAFYQKVIALQRKYGHGIMIENTIQTNGTMRTDECAVSSKTTTGSWEFRSTARRNSMTNTAATKPARRLSGK